MSSSWITSCLSVLALSIIWLPANAATESWVCAWPSYLDGKKPVIVRFKVDGEDLVEEEKFGLRYKILQNNEFSIVAAWSISEIERNQNKTEPSIGAMVVIINKKDGSFRRSNTILGEEGDAAALGSCTH
jgi:hypothetical protein